MKRKKPLWQIKRSKLIAKVGFACARVDFIAETIQICGSLYSFSEGKENLNRRALRQARLKRCLRTITVRAGSVSSSGLRREIISPAVIPNRNPPLRRARRPRLDYISRCNSEPSPYKEKKKADSKIKLTPLQEKLIKGIICVKIKNCRL